MTSASNPRPIWRWLKRILRGLLWAFIGLTTLLLLFYLIENHRGRSRWLAYKKQLEAQGERLDFGAYIPPALPEEQNFAFNPLFKPLWHRPVLWRANPERRYTPLAIDLIFHYKTMPGSTNHVPTDKPLISAELAGWQTFYRGNTNYPQAPASATPAQTVVVALSKFDEPLRILRESAVARPRCRYPRRYEDRDNMLLGDLAILKMIAQTLRLRAVAQLANANPDAAFADIKLGLFLGDTLNADALWISQLVRRSIHVSMLEAIQDGWYHRDWRDAHLQWFSQYFLAQNYLDDQCRVSRSARNYDIARFEDYEQERIPKRCLYSWDGPDPIRRDVWSVKYGPAGWFNQNKYWVAWLHQEAGFAAIDAKSRRVMPNKVSSAFAAFHKEAAWPNQFIARNYTNAMRGLAKQPAFAQSMGDVAAVCCGIERYRTAEGRLPEKLADLVPKYLSRLPHDVITGEPLKYVRRGQVDYSVYSVGWDGKDDGGQYDGRTGQGDWVWPGTISIPRIVM